MSSDRSLIAKIASNSSWAKTEDRAARTAPARRALLAKFEDEVDPDRRLAPEVRALRAESARRAHYQRMALASAKVRRASRARRISGGAA